MVFGEATCAASFGHRDLESDNLRILSFIPRKNSRVSQYGAELGFIKREM